MTLNKFLEKYKEARDFKIYLEIKEKGEPSIELAKIILDLYAKEENSWWKNRTMIISSSDDAIDYIAKKDPSFYLGAVGFKIASIIVTSLLGLDSLANPNYHCLQTALTNSLGPIKVKSATKRFVKSVHKHNQSIAYWGVVEKTDMQKLIDLGADSITVDSPDILAELLNIK